jgi:hypothetical protein
VTDGWLNVVGITDRMQAIEVYDARGRLLAKVQAPSGPHWKMKLPKEAGGYLVVFRADGRSFAQRVVAY